MNCFSCWHVCNMCSKLTVLPLGINGELKASEASLCWFNLAVNNVDERTRFCTIVSCLLWATLNVFLFVGMDFDLNPCLSFSGDDWPQIKMHRFPHRHVRLCPVGRWDYCPCPWGKVSYNPYLSEISKIPFVLEVWRYSDHKAFNHKVGERWISSPFYHC